MAVPIGRPESLCQLPLSCFVIGRETWVGAGAGAAAARPGGRCAGEWRPPGKWQLWCGTRSRSRRQNGAPDRMTGEDGWRPRCRIQHGWTLSAELVVLIWSSLL